MSAPVDSILVSGTFTVDIQGETDATWKSVSGGAQTIELVEATVGDDGERRFQPGKSYVSDITMTGYLTGTRRKALIDWINETAAGKDARRDVTVTGYDREGKPTRKDRYEDCRIVAAQTPRLSAGSAEPIEEVVVIRATRYASA